MSSNPKNHTQLEPTPASQAVKTITPTIQESAMLPQFFASPIRFHLGFFIALGTPWLVYWFLFKTKWGFDLRTVGTNPYVATMIVLAGVVGRGQVPAADGIPYTKE